MLCLLPLSLLSMAPLANHLEGLGSTVTDLMNRNRGNAALRGLLIFIFIIVMLILIGFAFYLSAVAFTTLIASVIYLLIAAIGTFATVSIYKRTFYKFNQEIGE